VTGERFSVIQHSFRRISANNGQSKELKAPPLHFFNNHALFVARLIFKKSQSSFGTVLRDLLSENEMLTAVLLTPGLQIKAYGI